MPVKDVLEYYGKTGIYNRIKYYILFIWRFALDKLIFFVFIKGLRTSLHRLRGVKIGKGVYIGHEVMFDRVYTDQISIGDYTSIGDRCIITAHANIPSNTPLRELYPRKVMPTKVGKGVWIMPNVTVAPGVTIGDFSVIATGSVITKDIPSCSLAAGVPGKVVKNFDTPFVLTDDKITEFEQPYGWFTKILFFVLLIIGIYLTNLYFG